MSHGYELMLLHEQEGKPHQIIAELIGLCHALRRASIAQRDIREFVNGIEYAARALAVEVDALTERKL